MNRVYAFDLGARIDHGSWDGFDVEWRNDTPGRVTARTILDRTPHYRVRWDDGYIEPPGEEWWAEGDLMPEEVDR